MTSSEATSPSHPRSLTIVTGSSRGLGEALARQSLEAGHLVVGIARGRSDALERFAHERDLPLQQWQADLANPLPISRHLADWLRTQPREWATATLINNAGVVTAPGPIDGESLETLSAALRVGLEATLLLAAAFLDATRDWPADRKVLNISSGLGRRAMAGSAVYCAAKAGMDNLSRAMALDEEHKAGKGEPAARVVSLAPGIIDTDMQVQLRGADASRFPDRDRFAAFKAEGLLATAEDTAARVLKFLARNDFGQQVLADVRDA
ncbi:short-chain dehydrogenase [Roseateles aquatilis]|uniref:Short-chain dehydrogenase n=1 Tax=Roseateles aquatilis TaxID=431061 RepID=A0A246J7Z8_9BURK|nr:SDR family NAD(P)-dependent oxidoreductase [Roseateles aquatilis]OWQ88764.1 short-chain dehydrogenase [Roseateles aquatilis]